MNVRIEAGPLTLNVVATFVECSVAIEIKKHVAASVTSWSRFFPASISVNGHSLKSINPELKVGELATSLA
ncbi:hypothetical protein EBU24_03030 [bacterium]|jgi:hypothetical protein|nr:hypothetical protein [bacterium]